MELRFDLPEVDHWAKFSGDYNPIHFELARARELGADALIVHGMLAMMPVKRELTAVAAASADSPPWRRFRALLRSPVPHGGLLRVSTRQGARGLQFRADRADAGEEYFRGSFNEGEDPMGELQRKPTIMADSALDPAQFENFHRFYGDSEGWVALDAVLFADFMRTKMEPLRDWARDRAGERMADGIEQSLIVHTSHTVTFASEACAPDGAAWRAGDDLAYDMREPEVIVGDGQLICTVPLTVKADGCVVMAMELGLLLKLPAD